MGLYMEEIMKINVEERPYILYILNIFKNFKKDFDQLPLQYFGSSGYHLKDGHIVTLIIRDIDYPISLESLKKMKFLKLIILESLNMQNYFQMTL